MISHADKIFGGFIYREFNGNITNAEIMFELKLLKKCETVKDYYRISRAGATIPLNRKLRTSVWSLYKNAKKHAAIIAEMKEAGAI